MTGEATGRGETSPARVVTRAVPGRPRGLAPPEARVRREARTRVAPARREPASARTELVRDATGLTAATADVMTGVMGARSGPTAGAMTGGMSPEVRDAATGPMVGAMTGAMRPAARGAVRDRGAERPVQRRLAPLAVDGVTSTGTPARAVAGGRAPRSAAVVRD